MRKVLKNKDFLGDSTKIARFLLGKFLVRRLPEGRVLAHKITEVEVYDGYRDRGSHASRGRTPRNAPMFGPAGHWYVYFTYGMHHMLNLVTRESGYPAAILIRSVDAATGPGRLTRQLQITREQNDRPAAPATGLWLEDRGIRVLPQQIKKGPRVGIDYAGAYWARRHLRFWI